MLNESLMNIGHKPVINPAVVRFFIFRRLHLQSDLALIPVVDTRLAENGAVGLSEPSENILRLRDGCYTSHFRTERLNLKRRLGTLGRVHERHGRRDRCASKLFCSITLG